MTATVRYLADLSALLYLRKPDFAAQLVPLIQAGEVGTCGVIELELLSLVRDPDAYRAVQGMRASAFPWLTTTDADLHRALEVQARLVECGYPMVAPPKLILAAVAERHGVTVLHCDTGVELIAQITSQAIRRLTATRRAQVGDP